MLVTSHSADASTKARGLDAGADDFINRPIDNLELIGRIKVMLRVKQAEDALREMNARLEDLVQVRTEKLHYVARRQAMLSRKVLLVQEEERARLSRELHDELGQVLSALQYELGWLKGRAAADPAQVAASFGNAIEMVDRAATELRRICKALRPPLLDDLGVEAALRNLVKEFESHSDLAVDLSLKLDSARDRISEAASLCLYRVLQESLHNVTRHAEASAVNIALLRERDRLVLTVRDDGTGFEVDDPRAALGCGIAGMRERAHLVDGSVEIESSPQQGTTVTLRVPLPKSGEV
jgi:signal transduction histidine kinase